MVKFLRTSLVFASLALIGIQAQAQEVRGYPNKPVKLIVPFTAGSLVDVLGRAIGEELQGTLKQSFVIDNKAGASTYWPPKWSPVRLPMATHSCCQP